MKANDPISDDGRLGALLRQARPAPDLPPRFQQNVWRRIEDAEAPARPASWLDALAAMVMRPRFAMVTAVALLFAGILTGTFEGRQMARHDAQMQYLSAVAPEFVR